MQKVKKHYKRFEKKVEDYICKKCGYMHANLMSKNKVPPQRCYRCQTALPRSQRKSDMRR
jgi:rubrerythrin